jgi:hypothetical protein
VIEEIITTQPKIVYTNNLGWFGTVKHEQCLFPEPETAKKTNSACDLCHFIAEGTALFSLSFDPIV